MDKNPKPRARVVEVKNYNQKELATLYDVTPKRMKKMLDMIRDKVGEPVGRLYLVNQVEIIFKHYTLPYSVYIEDLDENDFEDK